MKRREFSVACALIALASAARAAPREAIVGLPCDGCEAVFDGIPADLRSQVMIASASEPGERMLLSGIVRDRRGQVRAGVIVYAYHTDATGIYPTGAGLSGSAARHGRLRAWAKTDASGRYAFDTIRPAGYPKSDLPEHVHMHILEPGRATYYIDDVLFTDDARLTPKQRSAADTGRGGSGITTPARTGKGWTVSRDIVLGKAIPGYPA